MKCLLLLPVMDINEIGGGKSVDSQTWQHFTCIVTAIRMLCMWGSWIGKIFIRTTVPLFYLSSRQALHLFTASSLVGIPVWYLLSSWVSPSFFSWNINFFISSSHVSVYNFNHIKAFVLCLFTGTALQRDDDRSRRAMEPCIELTAK